MAKFKGVKPLLEWEVYGRSGSGLDQFLGKTRAVSERQACNLVRYRLYGETPYDLIPLFFWARVKVVPRVQTQSQQLRLC